MNKSHADKVEDCFFELFAYEAIIHIIDTHNNKPKEQQSTQQELQKEIEQIGLLLGKKIIDLLAL